METILVSIVSMALIVISTVTLTVSTFQSANKFADSWKSMENSVTNLTWTKITAIPPDNYLGGIVEVKVINEGQIGLNDFSSWDVIAQYESGNAQYLTWSTTYPPSADKWVVKGIYLPDGFPEVFDPNILNPGEWMTVSANLSRELGEEETARVTISTPNGVTSQCFVTRALP